MRTSVILGALLVLGLGACPPPTDDTVDTDTGAPDTDDTDTGDTDTDTGDTDTGDTDTGDTDTDDTDVPEPTAIYGEGPFDCDAILGADLTGASPALRFTPVTVDGTPERTLLSTGGVQVLDEGNLGGSSLQSEILAFEVLHRCEGASLLLTEGNIPYQDDGGKKTDLLIELDGQRIGVSVTRAVGWPPDDPYPVSRAKDLLDDKLADVLLSSENVEEGSAWTKQILFIAAYADEHAESLTTAWEQVDASVKADTVVLVSTTAGDDNFLYFNE